MRCHSPALSSTPSRKCRPSRLSYPAGSRRRRTRLRRLRRLVGPRSGARGGSDRPGRCSPRPGRCSAPAPGRGDRDARAQLVQGELAQIRAVQPDASLLRVEKAAQELDESALAGAVGPDEGDQAASGNGDAEISRHGALSARVAERGVSESTDAGTNGHIRMAAKRDAVAGARLRPRGENLEGAPVKVPVIAGSPRTQRSVCD